MGTLRWNPECLPGGPHFGGPCTRFSKTSPQHSETASRSVQWVQPLCTLFWDQLLRVLACTADEWMTVSGEKVAALPGPFSSFSLLSRILASLILGPLIVLNSHFWLFCPMKLFKILLSFSVHQQPLSAQTLNYFSFFQGSWPLKFWATFIVFQHC